jgi:hypothetical protein
LLLTCRFREGSTIDEGASMSVSPSGVQKTGSDTLFTSGRVVMQFIVESFSLTGEEVNGCALLAG